MSNFFRDVAIIANYWYYYIQEGEEAEAICEKIELEASDELLEMLNPRYYWYVCDIECNSSYLDELKAIIGMGPKESREALQKCWLKHLFTISKACKELGYRLFNKIWTACHICIDMRNNRNNIEITKELIFRNSLPECIRVVLTILTPKQIEQVFPIPKTYGGEKYGLRDYFSDREATNEIGYTKMLGKDAKDYIMNCNSHTFFIETGVEFMAMALEYANKDIIEVLEEINTKLKLEQELLDMINNK